MFASATIEQPRNFASKLSSMRWCASGEPPRYVAVDPTLPETIEHFSADCPEASKRLAVTRRVLKSARRAEKGFAAIVFVDSNRPLDKITAVIRADADAHAGGPSDAPRVVSLDETRDDLETRAAAVDAFRRGEADVLVATDVAARGIDVPRTTHVVHFDFPKDAATYLHRACRTARFGRPGKVITVVEPAQRFALERLANYLQIDKPAPLPLKKSSPKSRPPAPVVSDAQQPEADGESASAADQLR